MTQIDLKTLAGNVLRKCQTGESRSQRPQLRHETVKQEVGENIDVSPRCFMFQGHSDETVKHHLYANELRTQSSLAGLPAAVHDWPEEWLEAFIERAGIIQFDGGLPKTEAEHRAEELVRASFRQAGGRL